MSMTSRDYSLRWRLLAGTAGLLLSVLTLLGVGVWQYARHTADLSYDRLLTGAALAIIERIKTHNGQVEVDLPYAALETLALAPDDKVFYLVTGPTGHYLTGYREFPPAPASEPSSTPTFYDAHFLGEPIRAIAVSKQLSDPGVSGWVEVRLGQGRLARDALTREILLGEMAVLTLVIALALASLAYGIHRTLKPLNRLSGALISRDADDMEPLPDTGIREVKPLVTALDLYRGRLQDNLDTMQVFIADASHQIRTGLSGVQAQLDIAEVESGADNQAMRLTRIRQQHQQLTRLVNQLLTHALVAHRRDTQKFQSVSLDKLLPEILTSVVREHAHTDIEFSYSNQAGNLVLQGDPVSLREAIRNLLDNAVKYGPDNNHITLGSTLEGGAVTIYVKDQGPGIPAEHMERALQRFERVSEGSSSPGSGLGLAIAQTVIAAHGGTITLEALSPHGLKVTLVLPLEHP